MKKWFLLLALSSVFVACEEKEDDQIYSAQICINNADHTNVDTCLAKIAGISTPQAFVLRCSAEFIRAQITTTSIVTAIENIDENNSGTDPTIAFFQEFSFDDADDAATAVSHCTASGSKGLQFLAESAQAATTIKTLAGGDIQTWLNSNPDFSALDPSEVQSIGNNVLQMQPLVCGEGGSLEDSEVCDNINQAIASSGGDPQALGEAYLQQLQNGNN